MIRSTPSRARQGARSIATRWAQAGLAVALGLAVAAGCDDSGGTGVTPDYTLTVDPTTLTILPGEAGTTTVTLTRTDFDGEVTLTTSGTPAGISGSFDPAVTTGTTSTLTVGVIDGTTPGDYTMIVRGNSSAGTRARSLAITVSPPLPSFELAVEPSAISIAQGASATTGVILSRTDFTGPVTLALNDAPAGVTGSFDPAAPTGNGSFLTVTVGAAVPPGVYDLTVLGTGAPGNSSDVLLLTVTAAP